MNAILHSINEINTSFGVIIMIIELSFFITIIALEETFQLISNRRLMPIITFNQCIRIFRVKIITDQGQD